MKTNSYLPCLVYAVIAVGCTGTRPLRPGTARISSSTPGTTVFASELKQPENPATPATQTFERTVETELPLPRGTAVREHTVSRDNRTPQAPPVETERAFVLTEPVLQKSRAVEKATTVIGAAQKDTARELGARLGSLKATVWVGLLLFVFGLGSLAYPPLRAAIGSVTTSVALMAGGILLIVLPTLVVGHELVITAAIAVSVGGWFLAHRHGVLRGKVSGRKGD